MAHKGWIRTPLVSFPLLLAEASPPAQGIKAEEVKDAKCATDRTRSL